MAIDSGKDTLTLLPLTLPALSLSMAWRAMRCFTATGTDWGQAQAARVDANLALVAA
jgi:hypothetical protein